MSEFARFALAVFVTIVVWILWMLVNDVPGANFGAKTAPVGDPDGTHIWTFSVFGHRPVVFSRTLLSRKS